MGSKLPVLVVGAGPVGLAATAELLRRDVPVRCVDCADGPFPFTRSLAAWPRMMEILRGLDIELRDPELGHPLAALSYHSGERRVLTLAMREHTRPMVVGQPAIERLLLDAVGERGGAVEWGVRLLGLQQDRTAVRARLRLPNGATEWAEFSHVLGADGASSTVRKKLGIPFEGSTYPVGFVVADVRVAGALARDQGYYHLSDKGILALFGLPDGRFRVFTAAPPDLDADDITVAAVQRLVDERGPGGLTVSDPFWLTKFSAHARYAARMRDARVFLLGDAAHVTSPAGGQGLNNGIGDAHNLAWKLSLVWHGRARPELLDTYEPERKAAMTAVIRHADLQTRAWLIRSRGKRFARDVAARAVSLTRLADLDYVPRLAGLRVRYAPAPGARASRFSAYKPGALAPAWPVRIAETGAVLALREALDPVRYTVLIDRPGALRSAVARELLDRIAADWPTEVDVRTLFGGVLRTGVATGAGRCARKATLVLIRPDHHVVDQVPETRADNLLRRLESVLHRRILDAVGSG
ncbi:FAD-dependent monooxygenase [Actinokineospora sp.]|uniref:FAD-dependent monooxygenase n=1 Tax=Actinokineospora sp. TaxID=1872133 RepID=UPI00403818A8